MTLSFSWKNSPVAVAAVFLLLCYGGRNYLFGGLITGLVESQIEAAAGPGLDIRIGRLRGSWFTGLAFEEISTSEAAESGSLLSLSAERIELRYSLFGFPYSKPLNALSSLTAGNLRAHIALSAGTDAENDASTGETMLPGRLIAELLHTLPVRLEIDADAEVVFDTASNEAVPIRAALAGSLEDNLRLSAVLPGGTALLPLDREEKVGLVIRATDRSLRFRSLPKESSTPIDVEGRIEVSKKEPAVIAALEFSFEAGALSGGLSVTPERSDARFAISSDRAGGMEERILSDFPLRFGTLEASAEGGFGPEAPRSVIDLLLVRPLEALPFLNASVDTKFASWSFADLVVSRGDARISWGGNHLTLDRLELDAGRTGSVEIEGMVIDPAAALPVVGLERAEVRLLEVEKIVGMFTGTEANTGVPLERLILSASSDGEGLLNVNSLDIRGTADGKDAAASFRASGVVDVTVPSIRSSEFNFEIPDLGILKLPAGPGTDPLKLGGSLSGEGSYGGSLAADNLLSVLNGASGRIALEGNDLLLREFSLPSFRLSASISKGAVMVEQAHALLPEGQFTARARFKVQQNLLRGTIEQARLDIVREENEYLMALQNPASFSLSRGAIRVDPLSAAVLGGELKLEGTLSGERISGSVSLKDIGMDTLLQFSGLDYPVGGSVSAEISAEGPLSFPQLDMTIRGNGFSLRDTVGNLYVKLQQDDRSLLLDQLEVDFGALLQLSGSGRLPVGIGGTGLRYLHMRDSLFSLEGTAESLRAWLPEEAGSYFPEGDITIEASVDEESGETGVSILLRKRNDPEELGIDSTFTYQSLSAAIQLAEAEGNQIRTGLTVRADSRQIAEVSGSLTIPGLNRSEPQFDPEQIAISGEVSLTLPMEYLITFVPRVIHLSGMISGVIGVEGTLAKSNARGSMEISAAELRSEADIPLISSVNGLIRFEGREITVDELKGELGYSPFSVTAAARLPWNDDAGSVDARFSGSNILLVSNPDLRSRADADISARGTFDDLRISGTVEVTDALFTQNIPLFSTNTVPSVDSESFQLFSVEGETGESTRLDIRIRADQTIRIRNNLYSGNLSTDLNIGGTLQVPIPTGRIFGNQGELKLPLTSSRIRQILVQFDRENPFSPTVQIRGIARIRGYELVLNVSGRLPDVEVQVTSTPPLRQEQALVLLTTGFTPRELAESDSRTVGTLGGVIGIQLFSSLLGGEEEEESILDRVDIVIGKGISEAGQETIEIELRLGNGDSWYMVFERDRYDRYNLDLAWRYWFE